VSKTRLGAILEFIPDFWQAGVMDIDVSDFTPFSSGIIDLYVLALEADGQLPPRMMRGWIRCFTPWATTPKWNASGVRGVRDPHETAAHPVQRARDQLIILAQAFTERPSTKGLHRHAGHLRGDAHVSSVEHYLLSELRLRYRL